MKIRTDFVTNSSSASFVVYKKLLTKKQIKAVLDSPLVGKTKKWGEAWDIEETKECITGFTTMDNGYLQIYLEKLRIFKYFDWSGED